MEQSKYGSFTAEVEGRFLSVNPEMYPAGEGIAPTGRYFIYCIDPMHGSFYFIMEQDENYGWKSDHNIPFIYADFLTQVGNEIRAMKQ